MLLCITNHDTMIRSLTTSFVHACQQGIIVVDASRKRGTLGRHGSIRLSTKISRMLDICCPDERPFRNFNILFLLPKQIDFLAGLVLTRLHRCLNCSKLECDIRLKRRIRTTFPFKSSRIDHRRGGRSRGKSGRTTRVRCRICGHSNTRAGRRYSFGDRTG